MRILATGGTAIGMVNKMDKGNTNYLCKGCITFMNEDDVVCSASQINTQKNRCPCSKCIVKMICEESCLEFNLYLLTNDIKVNTGPTIF